MKLFPALLMTAMLLLALPAANADVLLLEAIAQAPANSADGVPRPTRGLSMPQVRSRYGEPARELPWVGDPPITRWEYNDFTVYFEHQFVINSVIHR